jgi:hypothetical protein
VTSVNSIWRKSIKVHGVLGFSCNHGDAWITSLCCRGEATATDILWISVSRIFLDGYGMSGMGVQKGRQRKQPQHRPATPPADESPDVRSHGKGFGRLDLETHVLSMTTHHGAQPFLGQTLSSNVQLCKQVSGVECRRPSSIDILGSTSTRLPPLQVETSRSPCR